MPETQVFRKPKSENYWFGDVACIAKINLFHYPNGGRQEEQVITEEPLSTTEILVKFGATVTPEEIQEVANKIVPSPYKTVSIDLSGVYHLNYGVLGKLHMLKLDLTTRSKRLVFQGCTDKLYGMLKMLNFDKTLEILRISPQQRPKDKDLPNWDDTL